jgi:hypothetical protein
MGDTTGITTAATRARTPPSLLGIERKIAYANRKYHSGCMCKGVDIGLAGIKLSGSKRKFGAKRVRKNKPARRIIKPNISL